ncbi:HAMP domain-containing sensor histidine kinase [uncultured Alsobacter sp.]|uniref:sensor histidine kinase n=1 Tax=uncultured Alsobacter sp. TaxID=1748258 RepID=UPI0025F46AB2|nr:HAMP domain-containing sensor histidine kinase [uncultured Alsobacter sp.]
MQQPSTAPGAPAEPALRPGGRMPGISARLLVLTICFVMLAEVFVYVPSIANFRRNWLNDRIQVAQVAALVLDAAPAGAVPVDLERRLVAQVGALSVAVRSGGARRLLAVTDMPPTVQKDVDLRDSSPVRLIYNAFETLFSAQPRYVRIVGPGMDSVEFVEIVLDETPLRDAMLRYSINILVLSLIISLFSAVLVYAALHLSIVGPVRRLTSSIIGFGANPEDAEGAIRPSGRRDEIGIAEQALSAMQVTLARELREKKHLAALGLAVSKINHDLRNMLSSAQLLSDRLSEVGDPTVQRLAPRIVAALDRAVALCRATLTYGRATERAPERRRQRLAPQVEELRDILGLADDERITFETQVPPGLEIDADPEHLSRILLNLVRNAQQILQDPDFPGPERRIVVTARRDGRIVTVEVADTGPGLPASVREHLFEAFSSARPGGTGLGLAIAAELVAAHGGALTLVDGTEGARFRFTIPNRNGG